MFAGILKTLKHLNQRVQLLDSPLDTPYAAELDTLILELEEQTRAAVRVREPLRHVRKAKAIKEVELE